jgi:hypothetical protein
MASVLNVFEPKSKILASKVNENFELVQTDISEMGQTLNRYVEGEITSVQSNLSSVQATLQENINSVTAKVGAIFSDIAPNYAAGYSISSGFIAPSAGWVACYGTSGEGSYTTWNADGAEIFRNDQTRGGGRAGQVVMRSMAYVEKGSVITRNGENNTAMFYPCKGVQ